MVSWELKGRMYQEDLERKKGMVINVQSIREEREGRD